MKRSDSRIPKMGRPPLPEGKAKGVVFTLRLSDDERVAIVEAAGRAGQPVTQWARNILIRAAEG